MVYTLRFSHPFGRHGFSEVTSSIKPITIVFMCRRSSPFRKWFLSKISSRRASRKDVPLCLSNFFRILENAVVLISKNSIRRSIFQTRETQSKVRKSFCSFTLNNCRISVNHENKRTNFTFERDQGLLRVDKALEMFRCSHLSVSFLEVGTIAIHLFLHR